MMFIFLACVGPSKPEGTDPTDSDPTGSTPTETTDSTPTDSTPTEDPDDRDGDGHPAVGADCDDHDPSVYIGATEVSGDGVDQNCDGLDGAPAVTLSDFAAGDWTTTRYDELCMATYGGALIVDDVTGDGGRDLVVGVPGSGDAETAVDCEGAIVLAGPAFDTGDMTTQWARWEDDDTLTDAGIFVAPSGDWTGDGLGDIVVGAPSQDRGGVAYVIPGSSSGALDLADAWATVVSGDDARHLGESLWAPWNRSTPIPVFLFVDTSTEQPSAAAYAGTFSGERSIDQADTRVEADMTAMTSDLDADGVAELFGTGDEYGELCAYTTLGEVGLQGTLFCVKQDGDNFGVRFTPAADTNSDGYADLLVGAGQNDSTYTAGGGRAGVFFGPVAGDHTLSDADMIVAPESAGKALGYAVALGDLDADGDAELVLGAPMGGTGAVVLFREAAPGVYSTADADLVLAGGMLGDYAGYRLSVGDLDADGHDDLAVATPYDSSVVAAGGRLYLVSGADVAARW